MKYQEFLQAKRHSVGNFGFNPTYFPDIAFDYQKYIIEKSVQKGRVAIFADTGLGKTLIQLSVARNILEKTNKNILILTPLAVGFQFIEEALSKQITDDIQITKDGKFNKKIVICNYERLHYLDPKDFECVILDESSILKNFDGKIKNQITSFIKKIPYRFLSTATPSPNDYIELGTSSEALGYMGYMDMLTKFFKNNQNTADSNNRNIGEKFYLKPHAEKDFFSWVNSWSITIKKPSDIGFSDEHHILPKLNVRDHIVENQSLVDANGQMLLFTPIAKTMGEVKNEQKQTITGRCEKAIELAYGKTSVYWCNLNSEGDLLNELDPEAVQISGGMNLDKKEEMLLAFSKGEIKRLITKPKITAFGLNWQHCNHSVFFPTWSYEQYYQAIRRFWRFGQKDEVTIDRVISDGQQRVIDAIELKTEKAINLHQNLTDNVNSSYVPLLKEFNKPIQQPKFISRW